MKKVLIAGSSGLVGSEAVDFFVKKNFKVYAVDNNLRAFLFGKNSSTLLIKRFQKDNYSNIKFLNIDITNYNKLEKVFVDNKFDVIIHAAGQPSHDWSAKDPIFDFRINAYGTLNLLELSRKFCPKTVFIYTSTNKVYGDSPNYLKGLRELRTRYEVIQNKKLFSVNEKFSIDNSKHSPFGVSKASGDLYVQEYGKYFNLKTVSFRCGCITGPNHKGAELHGFLSYLVKCAYQNKHYTVFGYKGKQVRDNLHSIDVVQAFWEIFNNPKVGEVYNIGGSIYSNISIREAINYLIEKSFNLSHTFKDDSRLGDHKWWISDVRKFQTHYPNWEVTRNAFDIIDETVMAFKS